ncbi:hypothetical protein SAMN05216388_1005111 [Halorientalis persicus]|jgi:hypothetical protein|uniref:HalX domain-containing protein n=1 Tax=Halorientalis persicus TaxID=1367881 RepID=A0A1H8JL94_9EURY|nr:hypothetical protein [Halorientalis persicus]SEN81321.1 hypothetical protein SAMN05216388_1005111 [Halorientalis persicus]
MDTWGNRVVLVAVADESRRQTYREWLGAEYNVWTAVDRLDVYEKVGAVVDVVLADEGILQRDGLGPGTFRDATGGCRVVLLDSDSPGLDPDLAMPEPEPERLATTTERLLVETACERLLAESATLAERKARLEQELDATSRNAVEEYRVACERFQELSERLDDLVQRTDLDWSALFDNRLAGDGAGEMTVGRAVE